MSMRAPLFGDYPIPADTYRAAHAAHPKGTRCLQLREHFGMLFDNQHFAHLYAHAGKPALAPARLAVVTILQFMDDLSDTQAAEAVRDRISWKYLLGLPLDDPGFDASVLSEFRTRLLQDDAAALLLDAVLECCRGAGLLKPRGKQRTDSTHVLAAVRSLHRLENVGETLRHALNRLATVAPTWVRAHVDATWAERYGHRMEQFRFPKAEVERQVLAAEIGADGYHLLAAIADPSSPAIVREDPAVATLHQVWLHQYYRCTVPGLEEVRLRTRAEQPPSAQIISSPYDPEARYKLKRDTSWVGYTVHLTETCDDDTPNLITQVTTTLASTDDHVLLAPIQADLAARDLLPAEHSVDRGYVAAPALEESQRLYGIDLVGPVQETAAWQAHTPNGLTQLQFAIDWEAEQVQCPEGKLSERWFPQYEVDAAEGSEPTGIKVVFGRADCLGCARRADCTKAQTGPRQLTLRPQAQHSALQAARARQETAEFKAQSARRAGGEGTFTQGNRRSDLRHARYIGLAKTHLQQVLTAVALNLLRVLDWLAEIPRAKTRTSAFVRLMAASP
jgi:transposase